MKIKSHVVEHTPIYDIDAYQHRQQLLRYRKNTASLLMFFIALTLPISLLFIGG